ncbi:avidin family protein [Lentinula edodes]|nr:avidin family protein [Lentinula edodes]
MILIADQNGGLSGQYNSAVGNATNFYNLTGRFDTLPPTDAGISVGWVVDWKNDLLNAHAVTTWSGQYFDNDNVETILTQWLLTTSSNCVDLFNNTLIEITNYCHSSGRLHIRIHDSNYWIYVLPIYKAKQNSCTDFASKRSGSVLSNGSILRCCSSSRPRLLHLLHLRCS